MRRTWLEPIRDPPDHLLDRSLRRGVIQRTCPISQENQCTSNTARIQRLRLHEPVRQAEQASTPSQDRLSANRYRRAQMRAARTLRTGHHTAQRPRYSAAGDRIRELSRPDGAVPGAVGFTAVGELAIKALPAQPHAATR